MSAVDIPFAWYSIKTRKCVEGTNSKSRPKTCLIFDINATIQFFRHKFYSSISTLILIVEQGCHLAIKKGQISLICLFKTVFEQK